jgi:hypothetical protein
MPTRDGGACMPNALPGVVTAGLGGSGLGACPWGGGATAVAPPPTRHGEPEVARSTADDRASGEEESVKPALPPPCTRWRTGMTPAR